VKPSLLLFVEHCDSFAPTAGLRTVLHRRVVTSVAAAHNACSGFLPVIPVTFANPSYARCAAAGGSASRHNPRLSGISGTPAGDSEVEELSFARSDGEESPARDPFDSTELIQKTVGLLSAHKSAIAEMVEVS
jgi:putative hemolysin